MKANPDFGRRLFCFGLSGHSPEARKMFVFLAQTFWDFKARAGKTQKGQLVSIAYSHFVEGARWCLDLDGASYEEHGYAPGQHILPVISVRVPKGGGTAFSASSNVSGNKEKPSPTSVPVMVTPSGTVLRDSWEVAASTKLKPIDPELKTLFDEELGPAVRALAYCYLFKQTTIPHFVKMCTEGRHWFFRLVWHLGFGTYLIKRMIKIFKTDEPATFPACVEKTRVIFAKIDAILEAKKTPYLAGDTPGVADVFLASLVAVVTNPDEYGGSDNSLSRYVNEQARLDPEYAAHIEHWRATTTGQYTLQLYKTHRLNKKKAY